jgi:hypothetical protein
MLLPLDVAAARLAQDMAGAGFPVVEQLGQYKVDSWPAPLWVYQVRLGSHPQWQVAGHA